jgi:hypothetical protein
MYKTIYLKFPDKETYEGTMFIANLYETNDGSVVFSLPVPHAIDAGFRIYNNLGTEEEPNMVEVPGYHANFRAQEGYTLPVELHDYIIEEPRTPRRVFC